MSENTPAHSGQHRSADVLIIGGGSAGMAAAEGAHGEGCRSILILERDPVLGGILNRCIHNGFGLHRFDEELTGPEYAYRDVQRVRALDGVEVLLDTTVTSFAGTHRVVAVSPELGVFTVDAKAIVLAMGCRERSRGQINIPGSRPAGVYTAGTAQSFVNLYGRLPGHKVVVLGSGDIGLIMARRMVCEGASVAGVLARKNYAAGLRRNIVQCLDDYNIPLLLSHTVTAIHGHDRLTGVTVVEIDQETRRPVPGSEREVECDTLLLSVGLIPENELSCMAGVELSRLTNGAEVDQSLQTNVPGIFACGNVLHVHDLVDFVSEEGECAGREAARYAACPKLGHDLSTAIPVVVSGGVHYSIPQRITVDATGDITVRYRVDGVYHDAAVIARAGDEVVAKHRALVVVPSEMGTLTVPADKVIAAGNLTLTLEKGQERPASAHAGKKLAPDENAFVEADEVRHFTCIRCPMGCDLDVAIEGGEVTAVSGATCGRGVKYAREEAISPTRTVTALVEVMGSVEPLSVKTADPIPKDRVIDLLHVLAAIRLDGPVHIGDVVLADACGTGVDVVATKEIHG